MAKTPNENLTATGFGTLEGGMNSGVSPRILRPNQYSFGVNTSVRGSYIKNRPGFIQKSLTFEDASAQSAFEDGRFMRASAYVRANGQIDLMAFVGGRLFRISTVDFNVLEVSPPTIGDPTRDRAWMSQGLNYLVVNDGSDAPIFYDGSSSCRSVYAQNELRTGEVIAFVNGRYWYSTNGQNFRAADIQGGPTNVIQETENTFLNEGGDFRIPYAGQRITAIVPFPQLDTSFGQGPIQVFTNNAIFSLNAPTDRDVWKDISYPIQTHSMIESGATSQESVVQVNGDIWYRSKDGIRSFILARRDFDTWGQAPHSLEVERVIDHDEPTLLSYSSGANFDGRLLMTTHPVNDPDHGCYHRGLISLDFQPVTGMNLSSSPVWDSVWTGVHILQLVPAGDELYAFTLNETTEKIELWRITSEREGVCFDKPNDGSTVRIPWTVETRSYEFDGYDSLSKLEQGEVWVDQVRGTLDVRLSWKPDEYPCWTDWNQKTVCQDYETCPDEFDECLDVKNLRPGGFNRIAFGRPPETCGSEPSDLRFGFAHQFRLHFTGTGRLKLFKAVSTRTTESRHRMGYGK